MKSFKNIWFFVKSLLWFNILICHVFTLYSEFISERSYVRKPNARVKPEQPNAHLVILLDLEPTVAPDQRTFNCQF